MPVLPVPAPRRNGLPLDDHRQAERQLAWAGLLEQARPVFGPDADQVIASYHDLWRIEQSFRMSKTDLAARPRSMPTRHHPQHFLHSCHLCS